MPVAKYANALLVLASVLAGMAVVELFLRIDDASGAEGAFAGVTLAGHTYELLEDPARIRDVRNGIVVVGDSFVAGAKCGRDENLTGHLARELARGDVINLGMNGTGAFSYAQRVRDYIAANGAPAAVVVSLYSNDIAFEAMMCPSVGAMAQSGRFSDDELQRVAEFCAPYANTGPLEDVRGERVGGNLGVFLNSHSYVYRLLREVSAQFIVATGISKSFGRAAYPGSWGDPGSLGFRLVEYALGDLVAAARTSGSPVAIVFYPNVENLSPESPIARSYAVAASRLRGSLQVPVHSGYDAFAGNPAASGSMVWSLTDPHPSCAAHAIMAHWIAHRVLGSDVPAARQATAPAGAAM